MRRWARRLGFGALVVLGAVALIVSGAWLLLSTGPGEAWLRRQIETRVDEAIAGSVQVGGIDLLASHLEVTDVALLDPDDNVVARVARAEVSFSPLALLGRSLLIDQLTVTNPELTLVRAEDGTTNLEAAIAPTRQEAPKAEGRPPLFAVRLDDLVVEDGAMSLRTEGTDRALVLTGIDAAGHFVAGVNLIDAALRAEGMVRQPVEGPLELRLQAHRDDGTWSAEVALEAADAVLLAVARSDEAETEVQIQKLVVPPALANAAFPSWPLVAELTGTGELIRHGEDVEVDLALSAASATARLEGQFNLARFRSRGIELDLRDVNLAELVEGGPRSDIELQLRAQGGGRSLETLTGELEVRAPASAVAGSQFGPIRIDARAEDGVVALREFEVQVPGVELTAEGQIAPEKVDVKGRAVASDLGLFARTLGKLAGPEPLPLDGRGRATFQLEGPTRNPTLTVDGRFPVLDWQGQVTRGVNVDLEIPDLGLRLKERWDTEPASGRAPLKPERALGRGPPKVVPAQDEDRPPRPIELRVEVEDLGLEELLKRLGIEVTLEGVTEANVELTGAPDDPGIDLRVRLTRVVAGELDPLDLTITARSEPGGPVRLVFATTVGEQPSRLSVRLPWSLGRLLKQRPTREQALRASYVVEGEFRDLPVPPELLGLEEVFGRPGALIELPLLSGTLALRGSPMNPNGNVSLRLTELGGGAIPPLVVATEVALSPDTTRVEVTATQGERPLAQLEAELAAAPARLREIPQGPEVPDIPVEAELTFGPVSLLDLSTMAGWFLPDRARAELPASGIVSGRFVLDGTLARPNTVLEAALHGLSAPGEGGLGDLFVRAEYAEASLDLSASLLSPTGGALELQASSPVELSAERLRAGIEIEELPIRGSLVATGIDPSFLSGASPRVQRIGGRIRADAAFTGTIGAPILDGQLAWEDGILELAGFGNYRDIELFARGDRDRIIVERLTALSGSGSARASAVLDREEDAYALEAKVALDEFPVLSRDQLVANVSMDAVAEGTVTAERVLLTPLVIDRARIVVPSVRRNEVQTLDPPRNITFVRHGEPVPGPFAPGPEVGTGGAGLDAPGPAQPEPPPEERNIELVVTVDAPRDILVIGDDFNVEVGLSEKFRVVVTEEPMVFGTVEVLRGSLSVLGRDFKLAEQSTIAFTGPLERPVLDVAAVHTNVREDVTVTLAIRGRPPELEIVPTSDPPLSETEIYTLLATGRRAAQPGAATAGIGASAVSLLGGFIAGRLQQGITEFVPVDYFRIEPGAEGFTGTRIETGAQITDRLFIGLQTQIGADVPLLQNRNQLELDYQLTRRLVLELIYGDARVGALDLLWRRRY